MNHELKELIENADMVRFIKSRTVAWLGHVKRMVDRRTYQKNFRLKTYRYEN